MYLQCPFGCHAVDQDIQYQQISYGDVSLLQVKNCCLELCSRSGVRWDLRLCDPVTVDAFNYFPSLDNECPSTGIGNHNRTLRVAALFFLCFAIFRTETDVVPCRVLRVRTSYGTIETTIVAHF